MYLPYVNYFHRAYEGKAHATNEIYTVIFLTENKMKLHPLLNKVYLQCQFL